MKIDKKATIKNILEKCNSTNSIGINVQKFNEKPKTDDFLIAAAKFCGTEIVYLQTT